MKKDLSIMVDDVKLNIRVGIIFKYQDKVLIELSNTSNSVIPGGRIKINEESSDAIKREIKEEMDFDLDSKKIQFLNVLEEFFEIDNVQFHEIFFVYNYLVDEDDYNKLLSIKRNLDNTNNYYEFIHIDNLREVNLLPERLIEMIKAL